MIIYMQSSHNHRFYGVLSSLVLYYFLQNVHLNIMIYPSSIQVTNPAIDPLREGLVMSLEVNIGKRRNILEVGPENASQVFFI